MIDYYVQQAMAQRPVSFSTKEAIEEIYDKPRFLDTPPKRMQYNTDVKPVKQSVYSTLSGHYNQILNEVRNVGDVGYVQTEDTMEMESELFSILRALLLMHVNRNEEISDACAKIALHVLLESKHKYGTTKKYTSEMVEEFFINALSVCVTAYDTLVWKAAMRILYNSKDTELWWLQLFSGKTTYLTLRDVYAKQLREKDLSLESLQDILKMQYSNASKDKAFMERVPKGLPKEMCAAMYLTHGSNPEVMSMTGDAEW